MNADNGKGAYTDATNTGRQLSSLNKRKRGLAPLSKSCKNTTLNTMKNSVLERFVQRTEFDSYEDLYTDFSVATPPDCNANGKQGGC